jgi:hypothetical protein
MAAPVGSAAAVVGAWAFVATVDPNEPGHYPTCPFLALTGWSCPGCGGLRAAHALAHGDLAAAAGLNLLFVLALPLVVVLWLRWVRARARGDDEPFAPMSTRLWVVALAVAAGFGVVRNLPGVEWLAP